MFATLSYPLTLGLLLAAMGLSVVATMALEVRTPPRRHRPAGAAPRSQRAVVPRPAVRISAGRAAVGRGAATSPADSEATVAATATGAIALPAPAEPEVSEPDGPIPELPEPHQRTTVAAAPPVARRDDPLGDASTATRVDGMSSAPVLVLGATGTDRPGLRIGGLGIDRDLAGVFFAAYVASGGDEASRVTGWISPCGNPPSLPHLASGDRLRGRVTRVLELMSCGDEGANWIMLDPRTDISLAVERRPPSDPVLAGLLEWWRLATRDSHTIGAGDVGELGDAIDWVLGALAAHPFAELAADIRDLAASAAEHGEGLRIRVVASGSGEAAGSTRSGGPGPGTSSDGDDEAAASDHPHHAPATSGSGHIRGA